jgi:glycosyltransferase involved in cell wall biosynthesis
MWAFSIFWKKKVTVPDPNDARPRILLLIKGLGLGGAERLLSEGSQFWSTDEFDYRVVYVLPWKNDLVSDLAANGIDVVCIGEGRWSAAAPIRLRRIVRSWRPALIHSHLPTTGIMARLVTSTPVVYTEHNLAGSYRPATRVLNRATYSRNREVIAVSDAVAESLAGYRGPRPHTIPNGVSVTATNDVHRRIREELDIDQDRPLVVHVGNIRPWKGHSTLIKAARVLRESQSEIVVVSIGAEKHAGDLARVRAEADDEGVGDMVRFLGRRHDAVDFIVGADVLVNPSDVEGLPLVVLEAMMAGTPVVATAAGGVPSIVEDGETGRLVPTGDPDALAKAVLEVFADREGATRMAGRARALAEERFGLEQMVDAHEALYRRVLNG